MSRPAIPVEIKRSVLVEAGHRCAISTCKYPTVDIHHIIPWEKCNSHDFNNLIALCPNCHQRADSGGIDRKSLLLYKSRLSAALGAAHNSPKQIEGSTGVLSEVRDGKPGYKFEFEYPVFSDTEIEPVSIALESWGNKLLHEYRAERSLSESYRSGLRSGLSNMTSASFDLIRNDDQLLSIKYRVVRYGSGAAHPNGYSTTYTYFKNPLFLVRIEQLFSKDSGSLKILSELSREELLKDETRNREWVYEGTEPDRSNFRAFNITSDGILLTFDEYQTGCYAAGPQVIEIPYNRLAAKRCLNKRLPEIW